MMKKNLIFVILLLCCLMLTACSSSSREYESVMPEDAQVIDFSDSVTVVGSPSPSPASGGVTGATPTPITTGAATPPPAASSTPVPIVTSTPAPSSTPKPTTAVVSTPKPTTAVVSGNPITKSPYSDTVEVGGIVKFVSTASNYTSLRWLIKSPDGTVITTAGDAPMIYDGLVVSGTNSTTLTLSNVPLSMDGCQIQCVFHLNTDYYSNNAILTVIGNPVPSDSIAVSANACRDQYASYASSYGYSSGSVSNYSAVGSQASFNVDFTNGTYLIRGEFASTSTSFWPVSVYVYDSTGSTQLRYQAISTADEFIAILINPVAS